LAKKAHAGGIAKKLLNVSRIMSWHRKSGKKEALFQDAQDWILEKNNEWPFSFENICEALQLNPDYTRRGLIVSKEQSARPTPLRPNVGATRQPPDPPAKP
jgi:hypothetical protein